MKIPKNEIIGVIDDLIKSTMRHYDARDEDILEILTEYIGGWKKRLAIEKIEGGVHKIREELIKGSGESSAMGVSTVDFDVVSGHLYGIEDCLNVIREESK